MTLNIVIVKKRAVTGRSPLLPVLLVSILLLTACQIQLGPMIRSAADRVARPLSSGPLDHLPYPDLKQWAARPGPRLEVMAVRSIPATLLIDDGELGKAADQAGRPKSGIGGRAGDFMRFVTSLLAIAAGSASENDLGSLDDSRRQLALNEFPFVLLQGEELLYIGHEDELWPELARADKHSKVTIITPDGTFFGIARRIHYRKGSSEIVLEGDPTVQSGEQHIKGVKPDTVMRLDFKKRRVTASGPVVEKKVFH